MRSSPTSYAQDAGPVATAGKGGGGPGSVLISRTTYATAGTFAVTAPTGAGRMVIRGTGGGGGGTGGDFGGGSSNGRGGGGAAFVITDEKVAAGAALSVVVGAGGAGEGAGASTQGQPGTASKVTVGGTVLFQASPGNGSPNRSVVGTGATTAACIGNVYRKAGADGNVTVSGAPGDENGRSDQLIYPPFTAGVGGAGGYAQNIGGSPGGPGIVVIEFYTAQTYVPPSRTLLGRIFVTTAGVQSLAVPAAAKGMLARAIGGGGGGSGWNNANNFAGNGGGGGALAGVDYVPLPAGATVTVNVGAGGNVGAYGNPGANGSDGGASTVSVNGTLVLSALGGKGAGPYGSAAALGGQASGCLGDFANSGGIGGTYYGGAGGDGVSNPGSGALGATSGASGYPGGGGGPGGDNSNLKLINAVSKGGWWWNRNAGQNQNPFGPGAGSSGFGYDNGYTGYGGPATAGIVAVEFYA